jgi:heme ABC exporter ATP-binding subunit CcmA
MTNADLALEIDQLVRRFGRDRVLDGVSLRMSAGRVVALRGHNGSGKTTLLRVLATRLRPSSGRVRVFGFDAVKQGHEVRRRLAYLPVGGGAFGALTAAENLRLVEAAVGRPALPLGEALERVGLEQHADRTVRTFSSGMKRRLGLARLLMSSAPLWLMDEPYASLDEDGRRLVDGLLVDAQTQGRSVLVVSHEHERLARFVTATVALERGRLSRPGEGAS